MMYIKVYYIKNNIISKIKVLYLVLRIKPLSISRKAFDLTSFSYVTLHVNTMPCVSTVIKFLERFAIYCLAAFSVGHSKIVEGRNK